MTLDSAVSTTTFEAVETIKYPIGGVLHDSGEVAEWTLN
jgi:hypothetical protein